MSLFERWCRWITVKPCSRYEMFCQQWHKKRSNVFHCKHQCGAEKEPSGSVVQVPTPMSAALFHVVETQLDITIMTWLASLRCSRLTTHADLGEESKNQTTELYVVSRASGTPRVVGFRRQTYSPKRSRSGAAFAFYFQFNPASRMSLKSKQNMPGAKSNLIKHLHL